MAEPTWFQILWQSTGKRILDVVLSIAGIILCLPFWLGIMILLRLESPGPVIYRQRRQGRHGKPFHLLKLRTMVNNAESTTGPVWAVSQDSRITRIGGLLRRTHFDETLQFINVLLGDMSLIGPRPEREEIALTIESAIPDYRKRLEVKPGITGLSQVLQRYDTCVRDVQRKVRYDILYIQKMCVYLDLKILYLTCLWVIQMKGE